MQLLEILIPATEQYPLTISEFDVVNITTNPFYTINNPKAAAHVAVDF